MGIIKYKKNSNMFEKSNSRPYLIKTKTYTELNSIATSKKLDQSDFRVHFTLMNVKWKSKQLQKQQKLVDYASSVINSLCRVQIVQIKQVIEDDKFDISVGLYNDTEAYEFLRKEPKIVISEGGKDWEYRPVISRVFQSFINKMNETKGITQKPKTEDEKQKLNQPQLKQHNQSDKHKQNKNEGINKGEHKESVNQVQEKPPMKHKQSKEQRDHKDHLYQKLWAFGIPLEYQIDEIKESLKDCQLQVGQCKWRHSQQMQFLEIELLQGIKKKHVYNLSPHIGGFPFVLTPGMEQVSQITYELSRYTVEIIIRQNEDDEEKFMTSMNDIGGVVVMLRTLIKGKQQFKYVIVFNNVENAQKACRVVRDLKQCSVQRRSYHLKIGRVYKYFTFTSLMQQYNANRTHEY